MHRKKVETQLIETKAKKQTIEAEKLTGDNIYKVLIYFEKLYVVMNEDMELSLDDDKHADMCVVS